MTTQRGIDYAAFCKIDGQIISAKAECVFFGNSATTRILPFLQQGHRVISVPVTPNLVEKINRCDPFPLFPVFFMIVDRFNLKNSANFN